MLFYFYWQVSLLSLSPYPWVSRQEKMGWRLLSAMNSKNSTNLQISCRDFTYVKTNGLPFWFCGWQRPSAYQHQFSYCRTLFFVVELQIFCGVQIGLKFVRPSACRTLADYLFRLTALRLEVELSEIEMALVPLRWLSWHFLITLGAREPVLVHCTIATILNFAFWINYNKTWRHKQKKNSYWIKAGCPQQLTPITVGPRLAKF